MELGNALSSALDMIQRGRNDAYTKKLKEETKEEWFSSTLLVDLIAQANASYAILSDKAAYIFPYTVAVNDSGAAELVKDVLHQNSFVKVPPSICMLFLNAAYSSCCKEFDANPNKIYERWEELTLDKVDGEIVPPAEVAEKLLEKTALNALDSNFDFEALIEKTHNQDSGVTEENSEDSTTHIPSFDEYELAPPDVEEHESYEHEGPQESVDPFKPY